MSSVGGSSQTKAVILSGAIAHFAIAQSKDLEEADITNTS
jgi:hypothetical protein